MDPQPEAASDLDQRIAALMAVYLKAARAMADVPIVNPALRVELRGWRRHGDLWLAVLVAPWTLSLLALPETAADLEAHPHAAELDLDLPCGTVRFVLARDPANGVGPYLSCSLFSPAQEFADMAAATATADACLDAVLTDPAPPPPPPPAAASSRRAFLRGGREA